MQIPTTPTKPVTDTVKPVDLAPQINAAAPPPSYNSLLNGGKAGNRTGDNLVNRTELSRVEASLAQAILTGSAAVNDEVFSPIPTGTLISGDITCDFCRNVSMIKVKELKQYHKLYVSL